ncbi:acyl-CoA dehydrogenase family protein [Streptomyces sp. NPDC060027]|uniref:acyl-CoA dehydrogenase family protein n=1 Tax=Streptomyces sp. NPDC060027 TaxID=3347040 RepID=UPI003680EF1C
MSTSVTPPRAEDSERGETFSPSGVSARAAVESLEEFLGGYWEPDSRLSVRQVLSTDDGDDLPWKAVEALFEWGFQDYLVPAEFGGQLNCLEELFQVCRAISRRDVRLVVAYGSGMLGANPVWLWGDAGQRGWLAGRVLAGDLGSFGMSERDHGSDLANCEFTARRDGGSFRLTGEKWPIGNATRGTFVTLYAKTGPSKFSLLLVDKSALPESGWANLPRVMTLGLRGHDLSGLTFEDCEVPASSVIGTGGTGIAQTLKTLQITRTIIAATSLGTLDTGLRICLEHTRQRHLYGAAIEELPLIRDLLTGVYLDILIGECVSLPATRALTLLPERLSLWSSVVKYLVPEIVEEGMTQLSKVLSARYYLQDTERSRLFQKLQRDHAVVGIFEGTSHVNLSVIASHLCALPATGTAPDDDLLRQIFGTSGTTAVWRPDGEDLRLLSPGPDPASAGWAHVKQEIAGRVGAEPVNAEILDAMDRLDAVRSGHEQRAAGMGLGSSPRMPSRGFNEARTWALLHAASCCVLTWWYSREEEGALDPPFADGEWLVLCLWRLLQRFDSTVMLPERYARDAAAWMSGQYVNDRSFSLTSTRLSR